LLAPGYCSTSHSEISFRLPTFRLANLLPNSVSKDGVEGPPYGNPTGLNASGILHYAATGYVAVNIMSNTPEHRPNVTFPPQPWDAVEDWAKIGIHTLSYAGPASVVPLNKTHGVVTHGPFSYAAAPGWVNYATPRNYTIFDDGDVFKLSAYNKSNGDTSNLFWRRAPSTIKEEKDY